MFDPPPHADIYFQDKPLSVKEVAASMGKSPKWVYTHAKELGGKKLGNWFFTREGLKNALQGGESVQGSDLSRRQTVLKAVPNKERSLGMGNRKIKRTGAVRDPHGLLA